jgi:hypothetical protein
MPLRFFMVLLASGAAVVCLTWPSGRARAPAPRARAPAVGAEGVFPAPVPGRQLVDGPVVADWGRSRAAAAPAAGGVVGGNAGDLSPAPSTAARVKADAAGRLPTGGQVRRDALGNHEVRLDNGVTATTSTDALGGSTTRFSNGVTASTQTDALGGTTTRYSNGVTASSRKDALGNTDTVYSDGTRSTTRVDPFGNQVTAYSDGRTETIRPDPFAPRPPAGKQ